ncbi:DUF3016 domain-containing protein [Pseudoxanthomonas wuyuanensis]|uniref:DUF3016 domain-containing protein n=1 Tax=Pseudoxanthomonas wuyuanensis TaxID=1073196 RepID=A0A286DB88_9GAMM|nr:DUF3016 domain-containing protein [Pseudoxanthomonas wuyuanensis]KAF1721772.1 DUF3016 domain-containing protein [Pseudoxanthomonas wuyuanensis]SOD55920.1 Protein of unknown function [Pseudoxanthomonas wuyuanensis]
MKRLSLMVALALAMALSAAAQAKSRNVTDPDIPRELPASGPVSVQWTDPAEFSELRYSGNRWEAQRGNWVVDLAKYIQTQAAKRLDAGQQLQVTITDISRAGTYLPVAGPRVHNDVRIVKDLYPPRMTLNFRLSDANGNVLSEGERKLRDSSFLMNASINDTDPLRYEKRMLDDWMRNEFGAKDS